MSAGLDLLPHQRIGAVSWRGTRRLARHLGERHVDVLQRDRPRLVDPELAQALEHRARALPGHVAQHDVAGGLPGGAGEHDDVGDGGVPVQEVEHVGRNVRRHNEP